jgi:hypothetical protein
MGVCGVARSRSDDLKWFKKWEPRYVVNRPRREFILTHFFEWSFGQSESFVPDKALFLTLAHPAELHFLANIYNWDDGELVLNWILESDLCTRATANLLFWRAAPDWYLRCDLGDESTCPNYNLAGFRVLRKVLEKYRDNSFSAYAIRLDPKDEIEEVCETNPKWDFPPGVYDVIDGVEVVF